MAKRTFDPEHIEDYRRMTPAQRLSMTLELSALGWRWLDVPDRESGDRKWAHWNREHTRSNEALLAALRCHAESAAASDLDD